MENSSNKFDPLEYSKNVQGYVDGLVNRHIHRLKSTVKWVGTSSDGLRIGVPGFLAACELNGVAVETRELDLERFEYWYEKANYMKRFPHYSKTYPTEKLRKKKALEHWLTFEVFQEAVGTLIDFGGCTSPFCALVREKYGKDVEAYHLDLPLEHLGIKPGVNGNVIGASADDVPLPEASVTHICAHNAIEHFEGNSYLGFFDEVERLLKSGGEVFVAPLFVARRTFAFSSVNAFFKNLYFPRYLRNIPVVLDEAVQQPYVLQIDARYIKEKIIDAAPNMDYRVILFENWKDATMGFPFALVGRKI